MGTLNTRISLRYDTLENWSTASGKAAVLNKGEIGICAALLDDADQSTISAKKYIGLYIILTYATNLISLPYVKP